MRLDEVLDRLKGMPPKARAALESEVAAAGKDQVWVPNPGPQTDAYFCEADELFYGGKAGGGKTDLAIGLALTEHRRSIMLRRVNKDALKLVPRIEEVVGSREGYNGQLQRWLMPGGKQLDIAGCEAETDKQRFKGDAHDLICVEAGTPVLMADGSHQAIESIKPGDLVQTLEGPRPVERAWHTGRKEAVTVTCGAFTQVQARGHALLTDAGWLSADDLGAACAPSGFGSGACISAGSEQQFGSNAQRLAASIHRSWQRSARLLANAGGRIASAIRAFVAPPAQGNCFAASDGPCAVWRRPALLFGLAKHPRLGERSRGPATSSVSWRAGCGASGESLPEGSRARCSAGFRQRGGHTHLAAAAAQLQLHPPNGAERPSPTCSAGDDLARIPKRSAPRGRYVHPYTGEIRQGLRDRVQSAWSVAPAGVRDMYDLQVAEVNHFITKGGFVNRNCFDEIPDFLESQYRFIIGWNRSTVKGQRCRVVAAGNPPTTTDGLWIIKYWGPWLDPTHPNPAKPGELRWFTTVNGKDLEVDGPGPHVIPGEDKPVMARSRTFIPADLADNPDLAETNYDSVLAAMPEEIRRAYRDGRFDAALKDNDAQVIPTEWIIAAQNRWRDNGHVGVHMTAMALDPAGGGQDAAALAMRYGGWYAPLISETGPDTADGSSMAALVLKHRRHVCPVVVDVGGGYGGAVTLRLKDNGVDHIPFNGSSGSSASTRDGQLRFANKRSEAWWKFREELDPDQEGGSAIALPPDAELRADLAAPTWRLSARGIQIESKREIGKDGKVVGGIVKRLGRSPGRGDAVVMCLSEGSRAVMRARMSGVLQREQGLGRGQRPQVVMGRTRR